MAMRTRLVPFAASILVAAAVFTGCRLIDGGGQGSAEPSGSAEASAASQGAAPAAPTDAPDETPIATVGTDYGY